MHMDVTDVWPRRSVNLDQDSYVVVKCWTYMLLKRWVTICFTNFLIYSIQETRINALNIEPRHVHLLFFRIFPSFRHIRTRVNPNCVQRSTVWTCPIHRFEWGSWRRFRYTLPLSECWQRTAGSKDPWTPSPNQQWWRCNFSITIFNNIPSSSDKCLYYDFICSRLKSRQR